MNTPESLEWQNQSLKAAIGRIIATINVKGRTEQEKLQEIRRLALKAKRIKAGAEVLQV